MQNTRLGVVGAGYWGPNLVRNCYALKVLDSVCDIDQNSLLTINKSYPEVVTTTRYDELLARPVTGVIIATPAKFHAEMSLRAIAAGKHVLVEKPLALTVEEGESIAHAAADAGVIVAVGHVLLYHPAVQKMRSLLQEGVIGDVWHLRCRRLSLGKLRDYENVWWSFAPHDVALMLTILGEEPRSVVASQTSATTMPISDVAYADFRFSSGRSAHIEVCWLDPEKTARIDVFGTRGTITLKDSRAGSTLTIADFAVSSSNGAGRSVSRGSTREVPVESGEPLRAEIQAFLNAIASGQPPETSAQQGIAVLRALALASDIASQPAVEAQR